MKKRSAFLILMLLLIISSLFCVSNPEATEVPEVKEEAANEEPTEDEITPTERPVSEEPVVEDTQVSSKDGMVLLYVPAGEFVMGSTDENIDSVMAACSDCQRSWFDDEFPQHTVYLDAYWIDKTEVTNQMFEQFIEETGYETDAEEKGLSWVNDPQKGSWDEVNGADWLHPQGFSSGIRELGGHPVVQVSWNDAAAYCEWVGRRLPTETEWEKAARGTDGRTYPWGDSDPAENLLNFADKNTSYDWSNQTVDDGYERTALVGSYPDGASPYGALDMAGNVYEWVEDWHGEDYYSGSPSSNPQGPSSGSSRVLRGGAWSDLDVLVRSASRSGGDPDSADDSVGFRCALSSVP